MQVSGGHAYLAAGASGFVVLDITTPVRAVEVVTYDTWGSAYGLHIAGDTALVADDDYGIVAIDLLADPATTGAEYYLDTSGSALGIAVDGDFTYVADGHNGLLVFEAP